MDLRRIADIPRQELKQLARRPFEPLRLTAHMGTTKPPHGWTGRAWVNNRYVVQEMRITKRDGSGHVFTLAIRCLDEGKTARQFDDLMLIKDQCWGPEANAVEVYPPRSALVDQANMTWLWKLEPLPFGLHQSQKQLSTGVDKVCGQPGEGAGNT